MNKITVTFGKYRGSPLDVLLEDDSYVDWLGTQGWWKASYEYAVLQSFVNHTPIPPAPKNRPVLEQEYDLTVERPAKVRRVTHRSYGDSRRNYECPNCGADDCVLITGGGFRCNICAAHATVKVNNKGATSIERYTCPNMLGADEEKYKAACAKCPRKLGIYSDHTKCGCLGEYECKCDF